MKVSLFHQNSQEVSDLQLCAQQVLRKTLIVATNCACVTQQ